MALELRMHQKLDLQLRLAPQIIQSIELLQLPAIDLLDVIEQELDTNEFLEKGEGTETAETTVTEEPAATDGASEEQTTVAEEEAATDDSALKEAEIERLEQADIWDDPTLRRSASRDEESLNAKMEAMQNTASLGPTLQDALLEQYTLLDLDERLRPLAEQIIYNIDENGYVSYSLEEVLEMVADTYSLDEAEYVLSRLQTLEPRGIAARSQKECLTLQLDPRDPLYELKHVLIDKHLDDLYRNRLPRIAKSLSISIEELKDVLIELATLTLRPGAAASDERNRYINPDLILEWDGQEYAVRLANEYLPELRLNPSYRDVLTSRDVPKEYREYVKRKVDSARAFIMAVEKRQKTLKDVARLIVKHQRDFFDYGPHYLKPLKMQQVADELGVHVSTISRATSEKYIQTHRGIFSLKDFFTGGTKNDSGRVESREAVKQKVKEIVEREDKQSPLSDDEIVERLQKNHGLKVARRTVTKYRKALEIPSSRQRREY
jgi:RNA polymerase sigma-54 factor